MSIEVEIKLKIRDRDKLMEDLRAIVLNREIWYQNQIFITHPSIMILKRWMKHFGFAAFAIYPQEKHLL